MQPGSECPYCSYPLLCHVRRGKLYWFCNHCFCDVPYGVEQQNLGNFVASSAQIQSENLVLDLEIDEQSQSSISRMHSLQLKEQITQLRHEQEKLKRLRDDFLSTTSHELRSPLANIRLAIQMLELALRKEGIISAEPTNREFSPAGIGHHLTVIKDACEKEIGLVTDLLTLQELEAGTQTLLPTKVALQHWLIDLVTPFENQANRQQQQLKTNISANLPPLMTDLALLKHLLTKLLDNACKFTPAGGDITVSASAQAGLVKIQVCNSVEIAASELEHVFDKFYRILGEDPWKYSGTGLGLALANQIAVYLGGTLQVESGAGQTWFSVELPCPESPATTLMDKLMSYVAYYLSRGKQVVSSMDGRLPFEGLVYEYWGYHRDFLEVWRQLQQRHDFQNLYLAGDIYSFGQFLHSGCAVGECARCQLPIAIGSDVTYNSHCPCDQLLASEQDSSAASIDLATRPAPGQAFLAIGPLPPDSEQLDSLLKLNGLEVTFAPEPDGIPLQLLAQSFSLVIIHAELSEAEVNRWVTRLRCYPQLEEVPMVALGAPNSFSLPWSERMQRLEDYLLPPLGGDRLARYLCHRSHSAQSTDQPDLHWFPR